MSASDVIVDYAMKFAGKQLSDVNILLDDDIQYWVQGVGAADKPKIMDILRVITSKFDRAETEVIDRIEMGNKAAVAMRTTFTLNSGEIVVDDLCIVAEVSNGRLVKVREYLDQSIMPHFMG